MEIVGYTWAKLNKHYQTYTKVIKLKHLMIANGTKKYTVQQVANILGIYRGTVINYEKKGIFPQPRRNPINGYREYTEEDVENLQRIMQGNRD